MSKQQRALVFIGAIAIIAFGLGRVSGIPPQSDVPVTPDPPTPVVAPSRPTIEPAVYVETDPEKLLTPAPMDSTAPSGTARYSLQNAEVRGLIRVEVRGIGGSSGNSLLLAIQRLTDDNIDVYIVPGTVFVPNGDVQRMVAYGIAGVLDLDTGVLQPVTSMYLTGTEIKTFVVEAYCLDITLDNPGPANAFQAQAEPAIRSAQIIAQGKREGLPVTGIQAAIWKDQDQDLTKEDIAEKFDPALGKEVDDAFEMLKRMPWPRRK